LLNNGKTLLKSGLSIKVTQRSQLPRLKRSRF